MHDFSCTVHSTPSLTTPFGLSLCLLCTCVLGETGKGSLIVEERPQLEKEFTSLLSALGREQQAMSKLTGYLACHSGWEGSGRLGKKHFKIETKEVNLGCQCKAALQLKPITIQPPRDYKEEHFELQQAKRKLSEVSLILRAYKNNSQKELWGYANMDLALGAPEQTDAVTRYFDGFVQYGKGYENRVQFSGDVNSGDISITISDVTMEDNGTYVCSVRLRNDSPRQSAVLSLFVLVAPSKPDCGILGTPEYGQTINLTCLSHEGSPKPKYTWTSFNIQNEPRALENTEGEQITLKNISADTSGFYICTSTNIVGTEFCNMTVSVVPPSMNIALYAGIIAGVVAAIIVIGILAYCCCCRRGGKDSDYEMTVQEERNERSKEMPTRQESTEEDVANA
ncbi:hypothetical protein BTVI_152106 [Pitangus sulphuratus]|nr:hypothetical protein BTVI_152106 [Pitangus sulphuratus]